MTLPFLGAEFGQLALILALLLAAAQAGLGLWGAARRDNGLMQAASNAALGQFLAVALAFALLTHGYVTSDFSILNVAENSHTAKPLLYKISGVWGNHEGSLVLWILILTGFGAAVALFGNNLPRELRARVVGVQALVGAGFLAFILITSNPFTRLIPAPLEGRGLNPILQDPGLAFHPPFLYLGYVGFSVAFSFAVAALIEGRVDAAWARWVRPWTLAAWIFLTIGIAMGSWWAYYELGWGGFWFWDPVENASLMPWLSGTALLHSAIVVEKRDTLKSWTILLAILTFGLSLLGTFLVRSGVLTSVHAFAVDPERGLFVLAFLVITVGGALTLYTIRAPALKGGGLFAPVSREGGLVFNNWFLATATATVLVGTLYPLLLDALTGEKVTVGPPYFNAVFIPIMSPLLLVMAAGPLLSWKRADLAAVLPRLKFAGLAAFIAILAAFYLSEGGPVLAVLGMGLGVWVVLAAATDIGGRIRLTGGPAAIFHRARQLPRAAWGTALAHAGMGFAAIGVIATSIWSTEVLAILRPGEARDIAGYTLTWRGAEPVAGPNYKSVRGHVEVSRNGRTLYTLDPETRNFTSPPMATTEAAIRPTLTGDLYTVVGEAHEDGHAVRFHFKLLVGLIWGGALMMAAGGVLSLSDRRLRIGAPKTARGPALAQAAE